jgi:hypothetical protein
LEVTAASPLAPRQPTSSPPANRDCLTGTNAAPSAYLHIYWATVAVGQSARRLPESLERDPRTVLSTRHTKAGVPLARYDHTMSQLPRMG